MPIFSILNHKGGVGKTTVSVNLAHALTKRNKRVLIIDNDTQCNACNLLLPENSGDIKETLYDLYDPTSPILSAEHYIYPTKYKNLFCVPNHPESGSLEAKFFRSMDYPKNLKILRTTFQKESKKQFDFTIIDNPPNLGAFVICALNMSELVIVPSKAGSGFSVEGVINAVDLIRELKEDEKYGNPELRLLKLLITQVDRRTLTSTYTIERLKQHFGEQYLFNTTIPTNTAFEQAELFKKTIFQHKGSAPGAKAFRKLCDEILELFS